MIDEARIHVLNDVPVDDDGRYVVYWMQAAQRADFNPALEYAVRLANRHELPVLVAFGLDASYPDANLRHFAFMLEGLAETVDALAERGIKTIAELAAPPEVAARLAKDAAAIVCDRGYLRHQRAWRRDLKENCKRRLIEVEGEVVVPIACASDKREWAARTLRPKLEKQRDQFIAALSVSKPKVSSLPLRVTSEIDLRNWQRVLEKLDIDRKVSAVDRFQPGTSAARRILGNFLRNGLPGYADARNDPADPQTSTLSPYLHFGQISPVEIALKVQRADGPSKKDKDAYLEELIVRRELAANFVWHTKDYDSYSCLPDWAQKTLAEHRDDDRPVRYTRAELEAADTDDEYWNAAMREMLATGYMHNYMRMYWGKKILEWCNTPEYAYRTAAYLNNRYFLDGRDMNSWSNVGWLFGLHDQAWAEREIFGKVRYMSAKGLKSKFAIDDYVSWTQSL